LWSHLAFPPNLDDLAKMRKRIAAMQHDSDAFKQRAKERTAQGEPDLVDATADVIASQLTTRLSRARENDALYH